jgi:hypothetical protein
MDCRKCPYFLKEKSRYHDGRIIIGYCKLRGRHITDDAISKEFCKDRAVLKLNESEKK